MELLGSSHRTGPRAWSQLGLGTSRQTKRCGDERMDLKSKQDQEKSEANWRQKVLKTGLQIWGTGAKKPAYFVA